ncbi:hypothetical protein LEN26_008127 [Aphanomyces euteiches]|nr:hypothetical protein AeMF1_014528 [Aphanomyces euteiches]KAH9130862.1 hypothetical protein LEN26_008127 [Aphanomyces euteiches]KAH9184965.1 hypothetical protein AeNC1_013058 [Aphanomyces euteiches]
MSTRVTTVKDFCFGSHAVCVQEELTKIGEDNSALGLGYYVWPSAIVLASFLADNTSLVVGKRVLELGAGTSLPGLLAVKLGAAHVTLTDKSELDLSNARQSIELNGLDASLFSLRPLLWGDDFTDQVDILVAADCFYNPGDFEDVVATMACILERNPGCAVITTYQLRSIYYTIQPSLTRWRLQAREIPHKSNEIDTDNVFLLQISRKD